MSPPSLAPCLPCDLLPKVIDDDPSLLDLPREIEAWPDLQTEPCIVECLIRARRYGGWRWPDRPVVFVSDPHADAESFLRSLAAAGVIRRHRTTFTLTPFGQSARVIVGGDCLDKGPNNLAMLDALAALRTSGAEVVVLAGNHDLRLLMAVDAVSNPRDILKEHLFVRMGRKTLPILREVLDRFVTTADVAALPGEAACAAQLLPGEDWETRFSQAAKPHLAEQVIAKEIAKLRSRLAKFEDEVARSAMNYRHILAAILKCREIFFQPGGAYAWFFASMDVIARNGSFLFVHAGLCDRMCDLLATQGVDGVNARYRQEAERTAPGFYFGPLANLVRTKYRDGDHVLTDFGVDLLHRAGVHMVIQGHVNNRQGQRLRAKRGLLHLEGDVTLDRASRQQEGLEGIGAGATLIYPSGDVIGLSRDYPRVKHFAPDRAVLKRMEANG